MIQKHTFPSVALFLLTAINLLPGVVSQSPFIINDDRIRSLDISPVLGRGYSIMTNTFQSTCLIVDQVNVPSYNYDYFYEEYSSDTSAEVSMSAKVGASFSAGSIGMELSVEASSETKTSMKIRRMISMMKIERYYASVKEEVSPFAQDAFTLLQSQDYVGFFKACGPNYIRSIRRAQEVTSMFKFKSTDLETSNSFSASLKAAVPVATTGASVGVGAELSAKAKYKSVNSSLEINIKGFGMGLNQEGSETLVATNIESYRAVMKFAFKSMTQNEDSHNIGMVYGMEVVPWVNNVAFQVAAKLGDVNIEIPLDKSLIPRAYNENDATMTFSETNRDDMKCKEDYFKIDKYGYCCDPDQLYDPTTETYPADCSLQVCVCKPITILDKNLVKDNMVNNGEFIARLDSAMRYKLVQLGSLEKCISSARNIPSEWNKNILKSNDGVKYDKEISITMTVLELKRAIDPLGDFGMIKHLAFEMDEWIAMYYSPCMAAIYGMNIGTTPSTDVSYFMAYPWYAHPECMHLTCITNNMRWDRNTGGCIPGLITGSAAPGFVATDSLNTKCVLDEEAYGPTSTCKHISTDLVTYHTAATKCWTNTLPSGTSSVDYLISHFCNPQVTDQQEEQAAYDIVLAKAGTNCNGAVN